MRDYAEQVKELRDFAEEFDLEDHIETAIMLANAADAIEELMADRNKALKRLCEWCGVCSEENQKALECDDIAMLDKDTNVPNKWISVEERLPEKWEWVLTCYEGGIGLQFIMSDGTWYSDSGVGKQKPCFWMPLLTTWGVEQ